MKKILLLALLIAGSASAQDSLSLRIQRGFSLSPISRKVSRVDGWVLGVGHFRSQLIDRQTVNGLNTEVSPTGAAFVLAGIVRVMYLSKRGEIPIIDSLPAAAPTFIRVNGINVSTGGFMEEGAEVLGLNLSTATLLNRMQGVSVSALAVGAVRVDGLSISPFSSIRQLNGGSISLTNSAREVRGAQIGFLNMSRELSGLQLGAINSARSSRYGFQIGLINRTHRGFQLGLLNINKKRVLPLLNW